MTSTGATIFLVDDDAGVLKGLSRLLQARGYETRAYSSSKEFLAVHDSSIPGCAVLDLSMPDFDGLELQHALAAGRSQRQVIFLTGKGDIPTSVRAMQAGAIDFLTKPVTEDALIDAISRAIRADLENRHASSELEAINARFSSLTPREHEVMTHVIAGRLNKQIAGDLGTVEKTVKVHRGRVMEKMRVRSVADLVRLAEKAGIAPRKP